MINVTLGEVVEVSAYYTATAAGLDPGIVRRVLRPGDRAPMPPDRAVIVLTDAHGNRVEITLDGVAPATQLRDAAAAVRRFHVDRAERAYSE